jgi:excisionase family DNA binding protein
LILFELRGESILDELITPEDVMKLLKISRATLNRWVKAGKIRALKLGDGRKGIVRFKLADVESFINSLTEENQNK